MDARLSTLRSEMKELRRRFLNGDDSAREPMMKKAEECAALVNERSAEVAKRLGMRQGRKVTAAQILRRSEFIR